MTLVDRPWFRHVLLVSTAIWVILGVGLWAHLDGMAAPLPDTVISVSTIVDEEGKAEIWQKASRAFRVDQDVIHREIDKADSFFQTIGALEYPVHLQINFEKPRRYLVGARRIELGIEIARARGHVRHALLKAWVLQHARPRFSIPVFRQDVIADVLLAVDENGFDLGVPGTSRELSYEGSAGAGFFEQIATLKTTCTSDWRPFDITSLCDGIDSGTYAISGEIASFSVRRVVGEVIWRTIEPLGAFERLKFARAWLQHLKSDVTDADATTVDTRLAPEKASLLHWQEWTRNEVSDILPADPYRFGLSGGLASDFAGARTAALKRASLDTKDEYVLDIAAKFRTPEEAESFALNVFARTDVLALLATKTAIISEDNRFRLLPGGATLQPEDLAKIRVRSVIWDSCETPSIEQVLKFPVRSDRTLVVFNCTDGKEIAHYRSYIRYGVEGFALDNRDLRFVQLNRPSLEFALEKGLIPGKDFLARLLNGNAPSADRKLGLKEAVWNEQMKAHRVLGAIEAIEWFRATEPGTKTKAD